VTERDNRAQDLVRTLLAEGWSQAEIARRIGRDPRLVRFVLKGLKPGTNLVEALTQLERGEEVTPPRRRHDRKGRTAKVRGKRGKPSHRPTEPDAELLHPRRSRAPQQSDEEVLGEEHIETHRTSHTHPVPRDNEDARGQASDLLTEILSEGRGQRMHAKLWIEVDEGGRRELQMVRLGDKGGYDCGFALEDVRMFRDALSWLEDQAGQQYGNVADRGRLVGVEIDVW
jgi:transcriptional regulator with XRE-family HTH domain